MRTLVAIDLETTGLDPEADAIIEIGAVRFRGARIEDEWSTLINPGRPLSPFITQLTGITDDMLAGAPRLTRVLGELEAFVGDLPILGHNVAFDLGFLQRTGLFRLNEPVDTYDLASVLLPTAARYDLASLASALGVPVRDAHRALEDARMTHQVFWRLVEQADDLPAELIDEISRYGAEVAWGAGWIFDELLSRVEGGIGREGDGAFLGRWPSHAEFIAGLAPFEPHDELVALDPEEVAAPLEPGGAFASFFPEYEHRPQQLAMLRAVSDALSGSRHLLVEAGTGTGKSMAYLLPAFEWAVTNGRRVVISTNTLNLQDQLIHKDIPDLKAALGCDYRAAVLKGRNNYLCARRLQAMRAVGPRSADEVRVLAKTLVWLARGGSGDRTEISLRGPGEAIAWSRLSADSEDCSAETCIHSEYGVCPYYQARLAAESAHVVVVNHALLLADIATGNRVIPEYEHLIVDEAHHLESATTNGLSFQVTEAEVVRMLRELGRGSSGILGQVLDLARDELSDSAAAQAGQVTESIAERAFDCGQYVSRFFEAVSDFLGIRRDGQPIGPYGQQERILGSSRTLPEWSEIEVAWDHLRRPLLDVADALTTVADDLDTVAQRGSRRAEDLALTVRAVRRGLADVYANLENMIFEPDPLMIYWAEAHSGHGRPSLHAAPLEVGHLVEQYLWYGKESVIMTSATLTTAGEFDYIRRRLNAYDAEELALGSPFDYESATLLYLINDIPEPTAGAAYQRAVENGLLALSRATNGRTLALFTSYSQLRKTSQAISGPLARDGIVVLEQGDGASRHALLETFRTTEQAVLLGTRSFWEGVDVPGEALSVLAIIRIPFDVPSDPIVAARAESYESPFDEYSVPEAVLRFRQGFGRLIRTASDRGVVATFDRRLLTKAYGRAFLDSVPRCTVRTGSLAELPNAAARWLGL